MTTNRRSSPAAPIVTQVPSPPQLFELTVVIPCLNEAETLAECIDTARRALFESHISGEIVVADNGSTDGSQEIAQTHGARVVPVPERGYGAALMGGILSAQGKYVLMADADSSYDFGEIPNFVAKLREGYDFVQGCRLETGGGRVVAGAMPALHRWFGNPVFSGMARLWFDVPIHDIHCGMRAFSVHAWRQLDQRCTGMEFASEMMIKASLYGASISEVPIVLRPDGRPVGRRPHLRTFRDGWRHLRFFLMFSPRWLFLVPGLFLILLGALGYAVALPALTIGPIGFDVHTLLFASLSVICGYQAIVFAIFAKSFAISEGLLPMDERMHRVVKSASLERGLTIGALALLFGAVLLGGAVHQWSEVNFGALDVRRTMRWAIPGMMFAVLGVQTIFSSFFLSILGMRRR